MYRDLESLVKDLQQSIIKRHPDSIAALIQAAGASDSMELRRKDRDAVLTSLRAELTEVKAAGEKRLRALRQEYEKIKLQYDQKMSTEDRARATLAVAEEDVKAKHVERPRTLTQAVAIIKNLETEIEKVRTFYQKKVIELQTRHKKAMVALKKGEKVEEEIEYLLPSCNGKKKEEPVEAKTLGDTIQVTKDDKDLGAVPITPSPDELASSAGALVGDAPTKGQYHVTSELVSLHFQQQQQQFNQQQLVIAQQQSQIQQLETLFRLTNEKLAAKPEQPSSLPPSPPPSKAMSFCKRSEDAYIAEISLLQAQVKASEAATIILQTEVRDLMTRNTQLQGELEMIRRLPKSPQLEHFEVVISSLWPTVYCS